MASYYWIKLYHEILDDPKMGRLPDRAWRRTIEFFLMAGELDQGGDLPSLADMAWRLRTTEDELLEDMQALASIGILEQREDSWHVVNFAKRQEPVSDAERQQRYRDRQRKAQYYGNTDVTEKTQERNEPVTIRNVDTDTDIDTDLVDTNVSTAERQENRGRAPPKEKPLAPKTEEQKEMFARLRANAQAKGRRGPLRFPSLECMQKYDSAVSVIGENGELDQALTKALERGITSVVGVTNYVAKWAKNIRERNGPIIVKQ